MGGDGYDNEKLKLSYKFKREKIMIPGSSSPIIHDMIICDTDFSPFKTKSVEGSLGLKILLLFSLNLSSAKTISYFTPPKLNQQEFHEYYVDKPSNNFEQFINKIISIKSLDTQTKNPSLNAKQKQVI